MKQVLLAGRNRNTLPPIIMWAGDDTAVGDVFIWMKKEWVVSSVYSTSFPSHMGRECKKSDRPHYNRQACVILDHHGDPTHPGN